MRLHFAYATMCAAVNKNNGVIIEAEKSYNLTELKRSVYPTLILTTAAHGSSLIDVNGMPPAIRVSGGGPMEDRRASF